MVPATPLIMAGCGVLQIAGCGVRFRILGRWKGQNFFQLWFACCVSLQFHIVQVQHVSLPTYVEGYLSVWSLSLSLLWLCLWIKLRFWLLPAFWSPKHPHTGGRLTWAVSAQTEVAWTLWEDDTAQIRPVQEWHAQIREETNESHLAQDKEVRKLVCIHDCLPKKTNRYPK